MNHFKDSCSPLTHKSNPSSIIAYPFCRSPLTSDDSQCAPWTDHQCITGLTDRDKYDFDLLLLAFSAHK